MRAFDLPAGQRAHGALLADVGHDQVPLAFGLLLVPAQLTLLVPLQRADYPRRNLIEPCLEQVRVPHHQHPFRPRGDRTDGEQALPRVGEIGGQCGLAEPDPVPEPTTRRVRLSRPTGTFATSEGVGRLSRADR
jgi:hypothetical protein